MPYSLEAGYTTETWISNTPSDTRHMTLISYTCSLKTHQREESEQTGSYSCPAMQFMMQNL